MKKMAEHEEEMGARILTVLSLQLAAAIMAHFEEDFTDSPETFKQMWVLVGSRICDAKLEFFQLEELIAKELAVMGRRGGQHD